MSSIDGLLDTRGVPGVEVKGIGYKLRTDLNEIFWLI